ncbi:MAG: molybdopterin molybdotransferase MoeA [Anaerolineae bacterium]|nr:molybdopterin molybdotransferase MoeA [Anaerolineae bacterium]
MLTVEQALERVLSAFHPLEAERVDILDSLDRVLAEDVRAGEDIPPHANSSMDGYAVLAADTAGASAEHPTRLRIVGEIAAGYVPDAAVTPGTVMRIMTGAPLPPGADAVVKVEDTDSDEESVSVYVQVSSGNYIRPAGEDVRQGELVLPKSTFLRPQEIGMLATLGHKEALVHRRPRVAILATGDEVVEIDQPLTPGKIRNTNSYSNAAQVLKHGGVPLLLGIARDSVDDLTAKIRAGLEQGVDLFLTSGGVSVGDFDLVKDVLAAEGEIAFWRVRMRPGKPLAFGHLNLPPRRDSPALPPQRGGIEGGATIPIIGLPGNPVSVMVSFEIFVRPAIWKMLGRTNLARPTLQATLMDGIARKDERRHYVRVRVEEHDGKYHAHLTGGQGSGILSSMVKANALAIIPEDWDHAPAGAQVQVMMPD